MLALLAGVLNLSQSAYAASKPVATTIYVFGIVTVASSEQSSKQSSRTLALRSPLYMGDTISTRDNSFTVIQFMDEAKMTLRPKTQFRIDRYEYSAEKKQAEMALIKGGLRVLTGLIGKNQPEAYKINTSMATLGIRGTVFDARLCGRDCADESQRLGDAIDVPEGWYVPVYKRSVVLVQEQNTLSVKQGLTGYATPKNLKLLNYIPRFLAEDKYPRPDKFDPATWSVTLKNDLLLDENLGVLEEPPATRQNPPDGRGSEQKLTTNQGDFRPAVASPGPVVSATTTPKTKRPPSVKQPPAVTQPQTVQPPGKKSSAQPATVKQPPSIGTTSPPGKGTTPPVKDTIPPPIKGNTPSPGKSTTPPPGKGPPPFTGLPDIKKAPVLLIAPPKPKSGKTPVQ